MTTGVLNGREIPAPERTGCYECGGGDDPRALCPRCEAEAIERAGREAEATR